MHDHARRTEAGFNYDDFVYARLLPHTAEDTGRIPHAHETLVSLILIVLQRFNSLSHPLTLGTLAPPRRSLVMVLRSMRGVGHRHGFHNLLLGVG